MSNESNFITGIVIGAIVGAAAGILLAPESGEETRKKIADKTSGLKEELDSKFQDISEKIKNLENEALSNFKDKFYDVKGKVKEQYATISHKVEALEQEIISKYKEIDNQVTEQSSETKNV